MQFSKNAEFIPVPDWYYNIEYLKELNRGYDYLEDLFVPGYFEVTNKKGRKHSICSRYRRSKNDIC